MAIRYKFPDSLKIQLTGPDIEDTLINLNRNGKEYIGSIELPPNEEVINKEYQLSLFKNDIETLFSDNIIVEGIPVDYLVFESDTNMTINPKFTNTGTLQYSTDKVNWNNIANNTNTSSSKKLYFRGMMDSAALFKSMGSDNEWNITNGTNVKVSGNINTLLNYINPPTTLADFAFTSMFYHRSSIVDISELKLPAIILGPYCYYNMFGNCSGLTSLPPNLLPSTTLAMYCYGSMFSNCTGITTIPSNFLPATILADRCYYSMFNFCTSLTTIPSNLLPATTLTIQCYSSMFYNCSSLVVNTASSTGYTRQFRIPTSGTGVVGTNSLNLMLSQTAETKKNDPTVNTIYYVKN